MLSKWSFSDICYTSNVEGNGDTFIYPPPKSYCSNLYYKPVEELKSTSISEEELDQQNKPSEYDTKVSLLLVD